jgi:hypothetical protein
MVPSSNGMLPVIWLSYMLKVLHAQPMYGNSPTSEDHVESRKTTAVGSTRCVDCQECPLPRARLWSSLQESRRNKRNECDSDGYDD